MTGKAIYKNEYANKMQPEEILSLWGKYEQTQDIEIRNELLMAYMPLVKKVVNRLFQPYRQQDEYDDFISCGVLGLMDAFEKFNSTKGASFETYAQIRIRGEVIDYMRSLDWAPVQTRIKIKKLSAAYEELSQAEGRMVTDNEVAEFLGISIEDLNNIQRDAYFLNVIKIEEMINEAYYQKEFAMEENKIQMELEREEFRQKLLTEISDLKEKEQTIMSLYYVEELTLKEIGEVLKLTESRICQIHSSVLNKLRIKLKTYK